MGIEYGILNVLSKEAANHYKNADELETIIINHSLGAAAAAVGAGWIPGAGGAVATSIGFGFTVSMYYRLCKEAGIPLSKNKLKAIASVVIAEVAAYLGVILAAEVVLTFIPGIGNLGAAFIAAVCNFAMVYIAGLLFIKLMCMLAKKGQDPAQMSEEELKKIIKEQSDRTVMDQAFKEAKQVYKSAKNDKRYNKDDCECLN